MENVKKFRLDFIDVIRAFAICMMLQGHFVGGFLADRYRDDNNFIYWLWHYCTGITAPCILHRFGLYLHFSISKRERCYQNRLAKSACEERYQARLDAHRYSVLLAYELPKCRCTALHRAFALAAHHHLLVII